VPGLEALDVGVQAFLAELDALLLAGCGDVAGAAELVDLSEGTKNAERGHLAGQEDSRKSQVSGPRAEPMHFLKCRTIV
jgi:hypothetical protein